MLKNVKNTGEPIIIPNNLRIFANEITNTFTNVIKNLLKMQSEFQKKKQDRDNKIVTAYQSLLGDGTPSTTAVNALSKKFGLTATSIFRIIKSNQQVAVAR